MTGIAGNQQKPLKGSNDNCGLNYQNTDCELNWERRQPHTQSIKVRLGNFQFYSVHLPQGKTAA